MPAPVPKDGGRQCGTTGSCPMAKRLKCIFDSNVFDKLIDRSDLIELIDGCVDLYITHVQPDENDCAPEAKKASLRQVRDALAPMELSTSSIIWEVSKGGKGRWTQKDNLIQPLRGSTQRNPDKPKPWENKSRDALIGETAIRNDLTLVTNDGSLTKKVSSLGGKCMSWEQLLEHCNG